MASKLAPLALLLLPGGRAQHVDGKTLVNNKKHIDALNSVPGATWTAGPNEFFDGLTFDDARVVLGTALNPEDAHPPLNDTVYAAIKDADVPDDFDATTHWSGLVHPAGGLG